jgi:6-phosphogluconolactonase
MTEVTFGHRHEIERLLLADFQDAAAEAIAARGRFLVSLAGGSVATQCFPALARVPLDWSRVHFFWVDERAVPPDHADSNFAEANRLWLTPAKVSPSQIHRMHGEDPDLEHAAETYAADLHQLAGTPPALDFSLLGVGPDGHVASLFPGHPALEEQRASVVAIHNAPKPPPRRITLTLPVLAGTRRIIVAASGQAKADIVSQALQPASPLPLGLLLSHARNTRVLLVE